MSSFENATYITPINLVEIETEFSTTTAFKGASNTFSSYPVINVIDNENPTQPYQVTSKKYVDDMDAFKAPLANPTFTGTINGITKSMVGLSNVDNISDANKEVSTATQTALDLKLSISTASSTYQPILSNASYLDATSSVQTQLNAKTTETFVNTAINNLINSAPSTLDTLGEISTILQTNINDIGTLTTSIAGKVSKTANETVSGILTFSQAPVMSGGSITSGTIADASLASTFLKTSDASSTYLTQANATTALNLKANLASPTFTGTLACSTLTPSSLITSSIFTENIVSVNHSSNVYTLNFASGNVFYSATNPSANFTINITNIPTSSSQKQFTITLITNIGGFICSSASATDTTSATIVSASAPKYASGTAPVIGTSAIVVQSFTVIQCFATKYIIYSASAFN